MKIKTLASLQTAFNNTDMPLLFANLRPHIAGPEAGLHRYTVAAEKAGCLLDEYDHTQDTAYAWPGKASGSLIDLDFVEVHIENALLRYFYEASSTGSTLAPVSGYKNRIATDNVHGFKANGSSYPRLASLGDRDVQVGDVVKLAYGSETLLTSVAALIGDTVAGSVSAATSDDANPASRPNSDPATAPTVSVTGGGSSGGSLAAGTYFVRYTFVGTFGESSSSDAATFTSASGNIPRVTLPSLPTGASSIKIYLSPVGGTALQCTLYASGVTTTTTDLSAAYASGGAAAPLQISQTSGTANNVAAALTNAAYNRAATGDLTDVYTITVIQAPTSAGDATTALLSVTSASGRDNVASFAPAAYASPTSIGTGGATVTFSTSGGHDFVVGQTWTAVVGQAWTKPAPTSGGTYSGSATRTYIVLVSRGGLYADATKPQITVVASDGADSSGPTTVTAAASSVSIGTLGVTIQFSGTGLRLGDIYYVPVVGTSVGAYKTLLLANNMSTTMAAASDLTVSLYLKKSVQVDNQRTSSAPSLNWVATQNTLTLKSGIVGFDDSLTSSGVPVAAPIEGGEVYAHYREWLTDHVNTITEVATEEDVAAEFGYAAASDIDADNPLAYGVLAAVKASGENIVKFSAIADPVDVDAWTEMLELLVGDNTVADLVPLSQLESVHDAYISHVSRVDEDDIEGEWRHAWLNLAAPSDIAIVDATTSSDQGTVLATLGDNPAVTGTQYTLLACTSGNGDFVSNAVAAGDVVRFLYTVDAYGTTVYSNFVVESVVNEDTLVLQTGHSAAVSTAQRVEIWRTLTATQTAEHMAGKMTGTRLNRNLRFVWPDQITDSAGNVVPGYHLCAAYAAARGSIAPHQGLRGVQIPGFSAAPRSTSYFSNAQLNTLSNVGYFVVSATVAGEVHATSPRSPDLTSVDTREEAMTFRDDAIRYLFFDSLDMFRGSANINPDVIALIDVELKATTTKGISGTRINEIGSLLSSATVVSIHQHATIEDKLVVQLSIARDTLLNTTQIVLTF